MNQQFYNTHLQYGQQQHPMVNPQQYPQQFTYPYMPGVPSNFPMVHPMQYMMPQMQGLPQNRFPNSGPFDNKNLLFVGDIGDDVDQIQLKQFFDKYGRVIQCKLKVNKKTNQSKFAFIQYASLEEAKKAFERLNSQEYQDNKQLSTKKILRVQWYKDDFKKLQMVNGVFIKNIDASVNHVQLQNELKQLVQGQIIYCRISTDKDGKSLGYGIVQFQTKEQADLLIGRNDIKIGDKYLQIEKYVQKNNLQTINKANLYIKNLPLNLDEQQVLDILTSKFSQLGEIQQTIVKTSKDFQKNEQRFAFLCYQNVESAQLAINEFNDKDIFENGQNISVMQYQKKGQISVKSSQRDKNNKSLYTKNLKKTVTEEQLKKVFEEYGIVERIVIKESSTDEKTLQAKNWTATKAAFIFFNNYQDAQDAIQKILRDQENQEKKQLLQLLYENPQNIYITDLMDKNERKTQLGAKNNGRNMSNKFAPQNYNVAKQQQQQYYIQQLQQLQQFFQQYVMGQTGLPFGGLQPQMMHQMGQMPIQQQPNHPQNQQGHGYQQDHRGKQFHAQNYRTPQGQQNRQPQNQIQQQGMQNPNNIQRNTQYQGNRTMHQQQQQYLAQQQNPQKFNNQQQIKGPGMTIDDIKKNTAKFLEQSQDQQREQLGFLLYPLIKKQVTDQRLADLVPKICGMLIDQDVFDVQEILEFIDYPQTLKERIDEAINLIQSAQQ